MTSHSITAASKLALALILTALIGAAYAVGRAHAAEPKPARLFEMRTYTAPEGKIEALHARFRDHTNRLFQKHGMELIGYWTPIEGEEAKNTLIYILAYPDRESRDRSFQAFVADPEWKKAHAASEKDGKLVAKIESKFLTPTDYSPIR